MLVGKNVYLCAVEEKNIEQLRVWRNDIKLRQYFREYQEISEKMQEEWYKDRVLAGQGTDQIDFEIHDIITSKIIGHCGLYYIDNISRNAELTIYIGDFDFRNCGYGSDAMRLLFDYGFYSLNLHKIIAEVYSNNAALDVYRHMGFKDEGCLKEHVFKNGQYWDSYVLGLFKSDWENKKNN